jgi:drug/metabolite transporter (DMT)-like permease
MAAIAFGLGSSVLWGLADYLGGLKSRTFPVPVVLAMMYLSSLVVMLAFVTARGEAPPSSSHVLASLGAGIVGIAGLSAFYRARAIGTMSVVAPISATGAALPVAVGVVSGDRPSLIAAAGLAAIVIGVVLASRQEHADAEAAAAGRTAIGLALISAIGFGGFFVLTNAPADASVLWTITLARAAPIPLVAAVVLTQRPRARPSRRLALGIAAVGTIDLAATSLVILANTKGDLSVVGVLGGMYPVATVLLAAVILHERLARPQQVGVVLALGGIAAVAAG